MTQELPKEDPYQYGFPENYQKAREQATVQDYRKPPTIINASQNWPALRASLEGESQ